MNIDNYYIRQYYIHTVAATTNTVRYKILEGENFGEFGELPQNRQNFLVQIFLH